MGRALKIYEFKNEKYQINTNEFNSICDKISDRPVAIYSINGPLRSGKSFFMNFLLRYLEYNGTDGWITRDLRDLFSWRNGADRETTGILMWSEPFILTKSDGTEVALLLMDTQGSFDDQTTMQQNAIVFSLSTLLSSLIIYNTKGRISEDVLQYLQYFTGFARLTDEQYKDDPFQKLLFLVRDFDYPEYEYGYHNDNTRQVNNYKKDIFSPHEIKPQEIQELHDSITSNFESIDCYLMPYPGTEVARNANFTLESTNPEFIENIKSCVSCLLSPDNLVEKSIGGNVVTGKQLKLLIEKYEKLFKSVDMPHSKSLFEVTAEMHHEMAKDYAIQHYTNKMQSIIKQNEGMQDKEFNKIHCETLKESVQHFTDFKKLANDLIYNRFQSKLIEEIMVKFDIFSKSNTDARKYNEVQVKLRNEELKLKQKLEEERRQFEEDKRRKETEIQNVNKQIEENRKRIEALKMENWPEWVKQMVRNIKTNGTISYDPITNTLKIG